MAKYVRAIQTDTTKLYERCNEVDFTECGDIIKDLKQTLYDNPNLVALSAPQLNYKMRVFCIKFSNGDIRTFINPMISKTEGLHLTRESNASLPGKEFIVPRSDRIIAIYQTSMGKVEENIFEGYVGEIFQQMVQMLDGILLSDFALQIDEKFDEASEEERNELLNFYMDKLKEETELLNTEINKDKDLLETKKAIDFLTGVATGKVQVESVNKKEETKEA